MRKKTVRIVTSVVLVIFISSSFVSDAFAQSPVKKLGRGLANVFTGFLELPANIVDVADEEGFIGAMSYGLVKGIAMTFLRTGVGVYETVTFLIPLPWDYEPILEPEFMMSEDNF